MPYATNPDTGKAIRGFAAMDPDKRARFAARGGSSIPAGKRSFSVDRDLAKTAGRKGGMAIRAKVEA